MALAALFLGFGLLYFAFSWDRDFWAPEEADFAAVTAEMSRDGEWLVPTLAGTPYFEKPPLLYWCGLLFEKVLRLDPHTAYRIPVALFGVLGLWVTYLAGLKFFGRAVGRTALLIHGTSVLCFQCSSWYITDGLFAACISLSMTAFGIAILWEPDVLRWRVLAYAGLAGACLSKSPLLGPYMVLAPLLLFLLFYRRSAAFIIDLRRLRPGIGLAVVAVLVVPWYIWMSLRHGQAFLAESFITQHFGRLVEAESHREAIWYYLGSLPVDFLPWSVFLPLVAFYIHVHFKDTSVKFFGLWIIVVLVTLSLVSSKQGKYLLPIWTPLSVLVAAGLLDREPESVWESYLGAGVLRGFPPALRLVAGALAIGILLSLVGFLPGLVGWLGLEGADEPPIADVLKPGIFVVILAAILAGVLWFIAGRARSFLADQRSYRAVTYVAGGLAGAYLFLSVNYFELNAIKSARAFCRRATSIVGDRPVAIYGRPRGSILYYLELPDPRKIEVFPQVDPTGQTEDPEKPLEQYLRRPDTVYLLIIDRDHERLKTNFPKFEGLTREEGSGRVGSRRRYLVLSNSPGEE